MGSKRWGFDLSDVRSTLRHIIFPILSGGAVAGLEVLNTGGASFQTIKTASLMAVGAGVISFLKRWMTDNSQ